MGQGPLGNDDFVDMQADLINPLDRKPISTVLDVGIRAINSVLTVGRGQRLGLFAGSGVGKSVLLGMMTRFTEADVVVVGLVGERGREVKEFIEQVLDQEGLKTICCNCLSCRRCTLNENEGGHVGNPRR